MEGVNMKQWFRKAALCLALALSVMALVACGSTEKEIAPIDPSIKSALEVLVEKELVYQTLEGYIVYDRFFSIWLKRL
jgi:hypothetical protein